MAHMKENVDQLRKIVEQTHYCNAEFLEAIPVTETFEGRTVWQGIIHIFSVQGHPSASRCYAWSSPIEGSSKRRYYAVLHVPPIDSPQKAVKASIVYDYKSDKQ
jgi:hypothetical protein